MKKLTSKIPAFIGLSFSMLSFVLVIAAFVDLAIKPQATEGMSTSFAWWIYSVISAMFAVMAYQIDGIFNIIRAVIGHRRVLHILLASVVAVSLPMVIYVGGGLGINILIWNIYHLVLCALEIISILCIIRDRHREKTVCCEETLDR